MLQIRSDASFNLPPATSQTQKFYSRHDEFEFAGAKMSYLRTGPLVRRRKRQIYGPRYQPMAMVQLTGSSRFEQFNREVTLLPRGFVFLDGALSCQVDILCDSDRILIRFPSNAFSPWQLRQAAARQIDALKKNNALFSMHVPTLWEALPTLVFNQHGAALSGMVATAMLTDSFADPGDCINLDRRVKKIQDYIEFHLDDEDLDATSVADVLGLSRRYIDLLFREGTGYTIVSWIWERRLQRAREQLNLTNFRKATVTTIALDIGFKSPSHFSRLFRKRFGVTPVQYRDGDKQDE